MSKKPVQLRKVRGFREQARMREDAADLVTLSRRVALPAIIYTIIYVSAAGWGIFALVTKGMDAFWSTWYYGPLTLVIIWGNGFASRKYIKPKEIQELEREGLVFENQYGPREVPVEEADAAASQKNSEPEKN